MKQLFKIFLYNFFVLFIIYLFLFSTNKTYAITYKIENIEVSEEYNVSFNKEDVIDKAFINAYHVLISKITISKDHKLLKNQNLKLIKSFVESFDNLFSVGAGGEFNYADSQILFHKSVIHFLLAEKLLILVY